MTKVVENIVSVEELNVIVATEGIKTMEIVKVRKLSLASWNYSKQQYGTPELALQKMANNCKSGKEA